MMMLRARRPFECGRIRIVSENRVTQARPATPVGGAREVLGISMSRNSQVLRDLRFFGAVDSRVIGKLAYYPLADAPWLALAETVLDKVASRETSSR
jgi:hypothetical protein